jgi:hypothetical protein
MTRISVFELNIFSGFGRPTSSVCKKRNWISLPRGLFEVYGVYNMWIGCILAPMGLLVAFY